MQGILFKPDMIKAIVEDRKTVTRRVVKFHTEDGHRVYKWVYPHPKGGFTFCDAQVNEQQLSVMQGASKIGLMPRYHVDEVVYIKEVWATDAYWDNRSPVEIPDTVEIWFPQEVKPVWVGRMRSPLHLRADFARYFIQITDVRAERLQEITINECKNEGIKDHVQWVGKECLSDAKIQYSDLWDTINPKYPFSSNPWDFRYAFKPVPFRENHNRR